MDDSDIAIVVSSISAAATFVAALIYYATLKEIRRQGENTYKPLLFIDKAVFFVQGVRRENIFMPTKWNDNVKQDEFFVELNVTQPILNKYNLKLYNIGFATAKNVNIIFSYDLGEFIKEIKELEAKMSPELKISINFQGIFISFANESKSVPYLGFGTSRDNGLENYISYILPVNITKEFSTVGLPLPFLELLNIYIFYFSNLAGRETIEINVPIITIEIDYEAITNKRVFQKYTLVTRISTFGGGTYSGKFELFEGE